jgi:hypothetical protein
MTDRTDNRGYSYPECDPPLVKDRSDIIFLRDLAVQVNGDAGAVDDKIEEFLEEPDSARIAWSGNIIVSGTALGKIFQIPYNSVTFDNQGGRTDTAVNALRPQERGWYLFTSVVRCVDGNDIRMMIRHVRNGLTHQEGRRFEGPAYPINGVESSMAVSDVLLCEPGDIIQTQGKVTTAGTFLFEGRLTMVQLVKLDV